MSGITITGSVTINQGVTIGGVPPSPPSPGVLAFSPTNSSGSIILSNGNLTAVDGGPGEFSVLTTYQMSAGNKYMVSYTLDYYTDPISWIGIGTTSMNYDQGLGYDSNSIGFRSDGEYRFGGTTYGTGYCNFTNVGDVIDLAIDTVSNLMWIRVNGGDWNNNPTANPATATNGLAIGGLSNGYPAVTVGGVNYYSQFSINTNAQYSAPSGFTFLPGGYSFTLSSSDITHGYANYNTYNGHQYPSAALGTLGNEGFTLSAYFGQPSDASHAAWVPYVCNVNSSAVVDFFNQLVTDSVLTQAYETVLWDVIWGPGSTHATGVVSMSGIGYIGNQIYMAPIDTTVTGWNTSPPANDGTTVLPGTYTFPATFTLRLPPVNKGGWC